MRKYWVGVDADKNDSVICTTKERLAKFFSVNVKTIDRWISAGKCTGNRYIFKRSIQKLIKDPSNNLGDHKSSWGRRDKPI